MTILELAQQTGIHPKWVAGTAGGEYHSSCPSCGGTDRFFMQPHRQMKNCVGSYGCRRCEIHGDTIEFARQFLNCSFQEAVLAADAILPKEVGLCLFKKSQAFKPITLQVPSLAWSTRAQEFVNNAYENLLQRNDLLDDLASRGLLLDAVQQYKIGWSDQDFFESRTLWGLPEETKDGKKRIVWIPRGIVIPFIESSSRVLRLKVRRTDWKRGEKLPKYVAISGSMNGLSIIGSLKCNTVIVVESELDAYALNYAVGDLACAVAVGSNIKNPDNITDSLAKNAPNLLICHDNDEAGKAMLKKWQKLYSHAKPCPTLQAQGKDIGEAIEHGLDVREWLLKIINPNQNNLLIDQN